MKIRASLISRLIPSAGARAALLLVSAIAAVSAAAHAQIYVANTNGTNGIGQYNLDGTTANASLIPNLSAPHGIALSGSSLFIANSGGSIGHYNINTGLPVNSSLVSGLNTPRGIAMSGTSLFVSSFNGGTLAAYNASNGSVLSGFGTNGVISGLGNGGGVAASGSTVFVTSSSQGSIKAYDTTTGALINGFGTSGVLSGLTFPVGLAVSGNSLYVTDQTNRTISEFNATSGATINAALATMPAGAQPTGISASGSSLFVSDAGWGIIRAFTLSGAEVGISQVNFGLSGPYGIASIGSAIPEPSTYAAIAGAAMLGLAIWQRRRRATAVAMLTVNANA